MGILQKLASIFSPPPKPDRYCEFTVRCHRCDELITGRADLHNELSVDYGEDGKLENYDVRKVLMGEGLCFQRIEVELFFDKNRRLINKEIQGGLFVEESTPPQESTYVLCARQAYFASSYNSTITPLALLGWTKA